MTEAATHASTGWADLFAEGRLPRFALICLGVWLNAADTLVTATIMPSVGAELGGYRYFGWAVAGFLVGSILAGASAGRIAERYGLGAATTVSGGLLAVGCALSALAPGMGWFLFGRVVQGFASGWITGFAMVAIAILFPQRHLARMFASVSAVWGIATILGPLVGGLFAEAGAWRGVFWLFAALAIGFAAAAPRLLRGAVLERSGAGVPVAQLALLAAAIGFVALADTMPSVPLALVFVGLGCLLLASVPRLDAARRARLLPRRSGDLSTVCGAAYASIFALIGASMGLTVYGPVLLQELRGLSPLFAGYVIGAEALSWTLAAFVVAGVSDRDGERRFIRFGALLVLVGLVALVFVMRAAPLPLVILAACVMGAGFGFSTALTNRRVIASLSPDDKATGSSALIAVRQAGNAVGAAVAGVSANLVGFSAGLTTQGAEAAAVWVFATAVPLGVFGVWAAFRLTGGRVATA